MPTPIERCDFTKRGKEWVCRGSGNLLGECTFGRGGTRQAAYDDYVATRRSELADMIDDDADEAEMVQSDGELRGGNLRDNLMAGADISAMRDKARRLRDGGVR